MKASIAQLFSTVLIVFAIIGCSQKPYTLGTIKTFDPDTAAIPEPEEAEQYEIWDRIDNTIFHQIEKPLDLNRWGRFAGKTTGITGPKEADNINALDEVPESSWFTHRHYYQRMGIDELKRGQNTISGPDTSGNWEVFSAKIEGSTPGFFIEDQMGQRFLIKFDNPIYPELSTSAEMIGSRFFYASGYTVPESAITYFNPEKITIKEGVMVGEYENKRPMTQEDLNNIVDGRKTYGEGRIRVLASKFVDGIPVGPWRMEGTRKDDPNDKVRHEHRRELRGMRILSSWLNDTDRRDANTFAVYNGKYIVHYVQDFGNTLGANGSGIHSPLHGQAYLLDPRYIFLNMTTIGMRVSTWETVDPEPIYPSAGYFRADVFKPGSWVPAHPIPAFENMTLRDAFWGAKLVTRFTEKEIRAIVDTGQFTNPEAQEYVIDMLLKRREKIGRYWYQRVNPVDKFVFTRDENGHIKFQFTDVAVADSIFPAQNTTYMLALFDHRNNQIGNTVSSKRPVLTITGNRSPLEVELNILAEQMSNDKGEPAIFKFRIITNRPEQKKRQPVDVYFIFNGKPESLRIIGVDRKYQ